MDLAEFSSQELRNLDIELIEMDLDVLSQELRNLEIELIDMNLAVLSSKELRNLEI